MVRFSSRHPDDFDDNGLLKAPFLFWAGLVVLARAWWLAVLVAILAPAGNTEAGFLWPDIWFQLTALVTGVPVLVMLFIYPLRGRWPALSRTVYVLILAALLVMVLADLAGLMVVPPGRWDAGWMFLCLDIACVVMLWPDRRLRSVFIQIPANSSSPERPPGGNHDI
ncbi:DUF2919 domain-containing protein [Salmonella enterica]|nr:DUF2919 domain-containing protein [Salmonella enterica]